MHLNHEIDPRRPLFIAAVAGEAAALPHDATTLITGIGTLNATIALAEVLARGPRPAAVINIGTAGSLVDGYAGVYEITEVIKHDFDTSAIEQITGRPFPNALALQQSGGPLPTARLATGDSFINDSLRREKLARIAELVDMEGYAVAKTCQHFEIPVRLLKQVSDNANEESTGTWADAVARGARELEQAVEELGLI